LETSIQTFGNNPQIGAAEVFFVVKLLELVSKGGNAGFPGPGFAAIYGSPDDQNQVAQMNEHEQVEQLDLSHEK